MNGSWGLAPATAALEVCDLVVRYPGASRTAVNGVSFWVRSGQIVGILGPNGAGKSSITRCITTLLEPSGGSIVIRGIDALAQPNRARALIGVAGQSNTLDSACTARENLYLHGRYHGMTRREAARRADELLHSFGMGDLGNCRPGQLSGGQVRRLQLARAIAHQPEVLLLDEPTNELDVISAELFWAEVDRLRRDGTAILLATHLLDEAERHCDRVVIIDDGQVCLSGGLGELRDRYRGSTVVEVSFGRLVARTRFEQVEDLPSVTRCLVGDRRVRVLFEGSSLPDGLLGLLSDLPIVAMTTGPASLRDIFLDTLSSSKERILS
jgi:lipooligosaccharide transport system ATP-binding protein